MWRKSNEVKPPEEPYATARTKAEEAVKAATFQTSEAPPSPSAPSTALASVAASSNQSKIGMGLKIQGELTGDADLFIDGDVEGRVRLINGRVTVGPNGQVQAEIEARHIRVEGTVYGNLKASESAQLGAQSKVLGDVQSPRIGVADGAQLSGKIETVPSPKPPARENSERENHREAVTAELE
jgi:cytoskeletal protein CcmA (bactofilin family)